MTPPASSLRRSTRVHTSPLAADLPTTISGSVLRPGLPSPGRASPHASSPRNLERYGNMNPFPIDYAFRPRLRGRLTLGRRPLPRKPSAFGGQDSHLSFRYSCLHSHFRYLQRLSRVHLLRHPERSPTNDSKLSFRGFGTSLSSVTLSAHDYLTSELLRTLSRNGCF